MEFTPIITSAVEKMKNYLPGIVSVEYIDTKLVRKSGSLGVTLLVTCNKNEHRCFLRYEQAEDMMIYDNMIDGIMGMIIREDLEQVIKIYNRKQKLKQLNELINKKYTSWDNES